MTSRKFRRESEARFEDRERALREKSGKPVEAPAPKQEEKKETPAVEPFNISYGQRA